MLPVAALNGAERGAVNSAFRWGGGVEGPMPGISIHSSLFFDDRAPEFGTRHSTSFCHL